MRGTRGFDEDERWMTVRHSHHTLRAMSASSPNDSGGDVAMLEDRDLALIDDIDDASDNDQSGSDSHNDSENDSENGNDSDSSSPPPLAPVTDNRIVSLSMGALNARLTCRLCRGYFRDATTIQACGHTFCLSGDSRVSLPSGLSVRIRDLHDLAAPGRSAPVLTYDAAATGGSGFAVGTADNWFDQGVKECVTLVLQDGREITCTPDHKIMTTAGWVEAQQLTLAGTEGAHRIICGEEGPVDDPAQDEGREFTFPLPNCGKTLTLSRDRPAVLALAAILGALCSDGTIPKTVNKSARLYFGHLIDCDQAIAALKAIGVTYSGPHLAVRREDRVDDDDDDDDDESEDDDDTRAPSPCFYCPDGRHRTSLCDCCPGSDASDDSDSMANDDDDDSIDPSASRGPGGDLYSFKLSVAFTRDLVALTGVPRGKRLDTAVLPPFVEDSATPLSVVREFLAGYYGGDGGAPVTGVRGFVSVRFFCISSSKRQSINAAKALLTVLRGILETRFGIDIAEITANKKDNGKKVEHTLLHSCSSTLDFYESIGFRFCCHKQTRLMAAASYYRKLSTAAAQRQYAQKVAEHHSLVRGKTWKAAREYCQPAILEKFGHVFTEKVVPAWKTMADAHRLKYDLSSSIGTVKIFEGTYREFLNEIGAAGFFAPAGRSGHKHKHIYAVPRTRNALPFITLSVASRRNAGEQQVYDISVQNTHNFIANGMTVHNCRLCLLQHIDSATGDVECPHFAICGTVLLSADPLKNEAKFDRALQNLVDKLLPHFAKEDEQIKKSIVDQHASAHTHAHANTDSGAANKKPRKTVSENTFSASMIIELRPDSGTGIALASLAKPIVLAPTRVTIRTLRRLVASLLGASDGEVALVCDSEVLGLDHSLEFVKRTRWPHDQHLCIKYRRAE